MKSSYIKDDFFGELKYRMYRDSLIVVKPVEFKINSHKQVINIDLLPEEEYIDYIFQKDGGENIAKEEAEELIKEIKKTYKKYFIDEIDEFSNKIKEAALEYREQILKSYSKDVLKKIINNPKKIERLYNAKTEAEKLESLFITKIGLSEDNIEMLCKCDWMPEGDAGFIFENEEMQMVNYEMLSI